MYAVRLWSVRHARGLNAFYRGFEATLMRLHGLFRALGYERMERRWPPGTDIPLPEFWGGYLVTPQDFEFWHGRANRMHDRFRYRRSADRWVIERLAP